MKSTANIPMRTIGPVKLIGPDYAAEVQVPLATYETPLWPSTARGAKVTRAAGGIQTVLVDARMTRSVCVEASDAAAARDVIAALPALVEEMRSAAAATSRFAKLIDWHTQQVGKLIYLRLEYATGDAAGHNMTTKASEAVLNWLLVQFSALRYVSISGNFCTDKKASAVNGILGRGKYVVAECTLSRELCEKYLRATPSDIAELNVKKNFIGTTIAGGLRSANAHVANILLAFYLATGQDAANIIEGSQAITHAEVVNDDLYFSVTLPNIIVGTVGNGKHLDFVRDNLALMGLTEHEEPGVNANRLALICAATVLCGELSLLAAQTNPGELMRSHALHERAG